MRQEFIEKVLRHRVVDTKKYRYIAKHCSDAGHHWQEVRRLPLSLVGTSAAWSISRWETVKIIK